VRRIFLSLPRLIRNGPNPTLVDTPRLPKVNRNGPDVFDLWRDNVASCRVAKKSGYAFREISPASPPLWLTAAHIHAHSMR
jgi:hypothetical protein